MADLTADIAALSFEDALAELDRIVRQLEEGKGGLDDSIAAYTRGVQLKRHCEAKLAEAEARIERIVLTPDGKVGLEPADPGNGRLVTDLAETLAATTELVEAELDRLLPIGDGPEARLQEAMRYAVLGGGKRLRPFLVLETAKLFNVTRQGALRVAAATEMLHCYSLVHDDLPAMDDDDLRRGRPSVHRAFDEATAILAGDALLTRAFELLAEIHTHSDPKIRCELVELLAAAAGGAGMVGGQMFDLLSGTLELDVAEVTRLQQMKTGRLIGFCCEAGGVLGKAPGPLRVALRAYAYNLGLAFQIADDLLDAVGDPDQVGKRLRKDAGKPTFVTLLGIERSRAQAAMLADHAVAALECFDEQADALRDTARYVVDREL